MSVAFDIRPAVTADRDALLALLPLLASFELPARRQPADLWHSDKELLLASTASRT